MDPTPLTSENTPEEVFNELLKAIEECPPTVAPLDARTEIASLKAQLAAAQLENYNLTLRLTNAEFLLRQEFKRTH